MSNAYGEDARIPEVFTKKGLLLRPYNDETLQTQRESNRVIHAVQEKFKNMKPGNVTASGINDTTAIGSNAPVDFSKSGDISGVFSEQAKGLNQSSIQMSNVSAIEESKVDKMGKMLIDELAPKDEVVNIKVHGREMPPRKDDTFI